MNTRYWALTTVLTLAAAPLLAADASSRHPSGSGSSGGSSSGSSRGESSSARSSASASSSSSHHESSSSGARRGDSRSDGRHRGHDGVRVYGGYGWGGYPYYGYYGDYYGGYYGGYYGPSYGGYYGWRGPYVGYGYAHDGNYGSLRVMVEPDDTEVYVDGYYAGEVDSFDGIFQRLHVKSGRHEIALKRAGFRTHRVRVYVPVGGTLHIRYKMERGTGVDPTEGVVGAPEPAESYAPPTRETQREEAQEREEAPSATRAGELHLIVKPADAAVYVDGAFRGNADDVAELGLPPGKHRIEVVRPGYVTFERDIVLGPGQTVEQRAELARSGSAQ